MSTAGSDLNIGAGKLFVRNSDGNVGIGTASPNGKLAIYNSQAGAHADVNLMRIDDLYNA